MCTPKTIAIHLVILILVSVACVTEARIKGNSKGEDRSLYYNYNYGAKNGNIRANYYNGGGRGHGGGYYYRMRNYNRYYYNQYYHRSYYNSNDDGDDQDGATDDGSAVDDAIDEAQVDDIVDTDDSQREGDDAVEIDDSQGDDYIASYLANNTSTDWKSRVSYAETHVKEELVRWYYTPPGEWTSEEWALSGGLAALVLGTVFCICMCCCRPSDELPERKRRNSTYDFDDYTSLDSRKVSSSSGSSTESDDNATYDSIMRLRSD